MTFGFPFGAKRRSSVSVGRFSPTLGYTEAADLLAQPGSIVSGQNVWIRDGALLPRDRISALGSTTLGDEPLGSFAYDDIEGIRYAVVASSDTVGYLEYGSLKTLAYASGASNLPPSGGPEDLWFGTSVYLTRADLNIAVFTNGVDPLYAWAGPSASTVYSTLTQAPIAKDVVLFDDRVVAWNIREISSNSRFVTRVKWTPAGEPEAWSVLSVGAGQQDLLAMRGVGTRIFATEDEMLLATDMELWRGRKIGLPFVFDFTPLDKTLGVPYPRAAIQTPEGLFWLGTDFRINRYYRGGLSVVGQEIRDTLRTEIANPSRSFFGYDALRKHLTLYYSSSPGASPDRAFTLHLDEPETPWTPQRLPQAMAAAGSAALTSSETIWNELQGLLSAQELTYNQFLTQGDASREILFSSTGAPQQFSDDTTLDAGSTFTCSVTFGALFAGSPDRTKLLDQVRLDVRADSASTLTLSASGNLGGSFGVSRSVPVPLQSNTSNARVNFTLPGGYHTLRLDGDAGAWKLSAVLYRARDIGERNEV